MEPRGRDRMRYFGGLLVGTLLLFALFSISQLSFAQVENTLSDISLAMYGVLVGMYALHLFLASKRWKLIVLEIGRQKDYVPGFFFYNLTLGQLSRILPLGYLAGFGVKMASLKIDGGTPVTQGFCCTAVEVVFNLFTISLLAVCGCIVYFCNLSGSVAMVVSALVVLAYCSVFIFFYRSILRVLLVILRKGSGFVGRLSSLAEHMGELQCEVDKVAISRGLATKMLAYTLAFYALGLVRCLVIAHLVGIDVNYTSFTALYGVSLLFSLVGLTPAGLGFVEVGWVGILVFLGVATDQAASFAVVKRILDEGTVLLLAIIGWGIFKLNASSPTHFPEPAPCEFGVNHDKS